MVNPALVVGVRRTTSALLVVTGSVRSLAGARNAVYTTRHVHHTCRHNTASLASTVWRTRPYNNFKKILAQNKILAQKVPEQKDRFDPVLKVPGQTTRFTCGFGTFLCSLHVRLITDTDNIIYRMAI